MGRGAIDGLPHFAMWGALMVQGVTLLVGQDFSHRAATLCLRGGGDDALDCLAAARLTRQSLSSTFRMVQLMLRPFGIRERPPELQRAESTALGLSTASSDPGLGMAWADTDNPVY